MNITAFDSTDSVMNDAMALSLAGKMDVFDSVVSKIQTIGRGQYGRNWISPEGNIYAAMRLPVEGAFEGVRAALVLSTLIAVSLRKIGFDIHIKWMNDLVIDGCKIGGILLEKKRDILIAGVGINLAHYPSRDKLRRDAAIHATSLMEKNPQLASQFTPLTLWTEIANFISSMSMEEISKNWHSTAEDLLLWKGRSVWLGAGSGSVEGVIKGLADDGALILNLQKSQKHFYQGSLWLV